MAEKDDQSNGQEGQLLAGIAILACITITGVSLFMAFLAWGANEWTAGGACLIAAAISAGFLLNAVSHR